MMAYVHPTEAAWVRRAASGALVLAITCAVSLAILFTSPSEAAAKTYRDVSSGHWARAYISWVTNQRIGGQRLLDDFGSRFRPQRALTRAQAARVLVRAARRHTTAFKAIAIPDVPPDHPYHDDIQRAKKLGLLGIYKDGFRPDEPIALWQFHRAAVLVARLRFPGEDWSMLKALDRRYWEPNPGWKPGVPKHFATEVAARYLGLRFNHPAGDDRLELAPMDPVRRDEAAYTVYQLLRLPQWRVYSLRTFNKVRFPKLSERQKRILSFAFRWVGYPHIYGGEFPTVDSPYGRQAHGGFDCSGFTWWVMKIKHGYGIPVSQRSAAQMAAGAKPRIPRAKLKACDLIFFGPSGPKSSAASSYHAALYIGNGWFIHSTGSSAGVSLASIRWPGWAWTTDLMWGRRLLKKAELHVVR
ncbi:MAG: C40 family peptidase [Actinobacteria bacterium]|nr:C40 family peptidase [Actinomycetota bacterium]